MGVGYSNSLNTEDEGRNERLHGNVLRVDLTTGEIRKETIPDTVYEHLLSGVGLGAYYLYKHIPAGADPMGPDNILVF